MIEELKEKGWYLTPAGLEACKDSLDKVNVSAIIRRALDFDLKEINGSFLSEEIYKNKVDHVSGPCVLQIQKIKNVSSPKYEAFSHGPGLLRVHVTDGKTTVSCLQWGRWKSINMDTPPGTKILLKHNAKVPVQNGMLLLKEDQITLLGGQVANLFEKWELSKSLATHVRRGDSSDDGPPPWIPFGKSINYKDPKTSSNDFKSLEQETNQKEDNVIFKQQRQANIAEVSKAKEGKNKVFGGGKEKPAGTKQEAEKPPSKFNQVRKNPTYAEPSSSSLSTANTSFSNNSAPRKSYSNDFTANRSDKDYSYNQKYDSYKKPERERYKKNDGQQNNDFNYKQTKPVYGNSSNPTFGNNNYGNRNNAQNPNYYGNLSGYERGDFPPPGARNGSDVNQMMSNLTLQENRNSPNNFIPGEDVLARYWEDMRFYPAKIHDVGKNGTCVVHFVEYGNFEEVRMNDIRPLTSNWDNDRRQKNPPDQGFGENNHFTGVLEFRRGGNKPYVGNKPQSSSDEFNHDRRNNRQQRSDYRPSAKFFQPQYNRQPQ